MLFLAAPHLLLRHHAWHRGVHCSGKQSLQLLIWVIEWLPVLPKSRRGEISQALRARSVCMQAISSEAFIEGSISSARSSTSGSSTQLPCDIQILVSEQLRGSLHPAYPKTRALKASSMTASCRISAAILCDSSTASVHVASRQLTQPCSHKLEALRALQH